MSRLTRGTIEAQVAAAVVQFQREQQGRGPSNVRVNLIGDLLLVRSTGIFTPTELKLLHTEEGKRIVKSARQELRSIVRGDQEALISAIAACRIVRSYGDIDVDAAEQVEVFVFEADMEKRLLRQELDALNSLGTARSS